MLHFIHSENLYSGLTETYSGAVIGIV